MKKHGVNEVRTVVVLWGTQADDKALPAGGRKDPDGTVVIHGRGIKAWAMRQGRDKLSPEQINGVWSAMEKQLRGRDALEQARNPLPRSMQELVMTAMGCLVLCCVAVVSSSSALQFSGSPLVLAAYTGVAIAGGLVARKRLRQRILATAWLLGSSVLPVIWVLAVAWAQLGRIL